MINNNTLRHHADQPVDPAQALHTTLPMEDLIGLFAGEVRDLIEYDSFEFENGKQPLHVYIGVPKLHKCHYRLVSGDIEFGLITLTRHTPFVERELHMIEGALGALAIHLGNALHFESALSCESLLTLKADRKRAALD